MADDLLDDLITYCLCGHVDYGWYYSVGGEGCPLCRAKAEIDRLRAAGDALVAVLRSGSDCGWDAAIDDWEEARRG